MSDHKLYVIDASGYLYRSYFAIRNMTNPNGESTNALFGFIRSFLKLVKDFHPTHAVAVFDGPNNAAKRKALYSEYKAHRTAMPPDLRYQIEWAKQFCDLWGLPHLDIPEVEADDTMGALAVWGKDHFEHIYLCTSDKDMCQVVNDKVHLLNTHKENQIIDPKQVEEIHGIPPHQMIDLLAIIGDSSDNVPGVAGLGPKTACALLKEFGTLENLLEKAPTISGKKSELLLANAENARLSKLLVTIDTQVPIPSDASFYELRKVDIGHLKEFYHKMNFRTLIAELPQEVGELIVERTPAPIDYVIVDNEEDLHHLVSQLCHAKELCFDTETTCERPLKAELVGIGLATEPCKAHYIPVNGNLTLSQVLEAVKPLFSNPEIGFYGHNVKYDLQVLKNYGIDVANISFDTILASYILNAHMRQHSLDTLSEEFFGFTKIPTSELIGKGKQAITMREVPIEKVANYCGEDVDYTCRLKHLLADKLTERELTSILTSVELPLLRVLADMERKGIYLDVPYLQKMSVEIISMIGALEEEIFALAGKTFNLNSPKQLSDILFNHLGIKPPKKTATGHSTSADVLESLKLQYPIAGKIIEYRVLEKLRSTYIDTLPNEVDPRTQRIHCNFNQSVAATGRLASQDPNLQNIPIRTEVGRKIRAAFKPQKEGWSFLAADYSQIELRLLAHLSQDEELIDAFNKGDDIHVRTASKIFHVPIEAVSKEQRYRAKAVNFGVIYGQQAYGLAQELGVDFKEAAGIIEKYFEQYPGVKTYIEESKAKARLSGKATTLIGRERILPEILSKNMQIRALAERLAINTPLQGSQADLIKLAMIQIHRALKEEGMEAYMILQIHDELVFEAPDDELEKLGQKVKSIMEGIWKLRIPLIVDIAIGKNWAEC